MNYSNTIPVYKDLIARKLMDEHYRVKTIRPNNKHPGNTVYYFFNDPGIKQRISQIISELNLNQNKPIQKEGQYYDNK